MDMHSSTKLAEILKTLPALIFMSRITSQLSKRLTSTGGPTVPQPHVLPESVTVYLTNSVDGILS